MRLTGMRGSATGFVSVHACVVPDSARLGATGVAASIIGRVRDSGALLGAVAVGLAQAALEAAHAHAERRGLYAHQAVRHRLVDLATEVESARAVVERAGRRTAADPGMATLHSKLATPPRRRSGWWRTWPASWDRRVTWRRIRSTGSGGTPGPSALMGPTNDLCKELVSLPWNR